jgi:hypothetical protein
MDSWGIISDAEVHFTPEYFHSLNWEKRNDRMFLHYFNGEQRTIECAIIQLLGAHMMILRVLDECLNDSFSHSGEWCGLRDEVHAGAKPWADNLGI